jgi:Protein of unknown function (DUF3160)
MTARVWFFVTASALTACSAATSTDHEPGPEFDDPSTPGTLIASELPASDRAALSELDIELAQLSEATAQSLQDAHPVRFEDTLDFDPMAAVGLDQIQASGLALDAVELEKLNEQGFAISARQKFPNMVYGLKTIYAHDLPVYISIDPILDAVHNAFNDILMAVELSILRPDLEQLVTLARERNAEITADGHVRKDLDFYFTVALGLLEGTPVAPIAGSDPVASETFVRSALAATGIERVTLFGVERDIDFSQFAPRGHYTNLPDLGRYFQAMMWLGRIEFRLIETKPDGAQLFHRRQLNAALALRELIQGQAAEAFARIDEVQTAYIGEHDYMQLGEFDALLRDLGAKTFADLAQLSDTQIAQTILDKGYGAQRILSQVIFKDRSTANQTLPIDRSFVLLGQRYVVDAHVFSEVTYDRVLPAPGEPIRRLPDPLDAAYATLGNSAALPLLRDELESYGYAPQLERMRKLVDTHEPEFWEANLYNLWLSSLRALSPSSSDEADMPSVARTERWSRRVLNTQLASWAQLRHDTVLYVKQSFSSDLSCEFPDAYVDPYPEAFARLAKFAERGLAMSRLLRDGASPGIAVRAENYYSELASISNILREMAEQQREGVPFNEAQLAFVNDAVRTQPGACGGPPVYKGWYTRLMLNDTDTEMDPTITDVHTDPGGTEPPQVLHVATGLPRLMVLTVDSCTGPRAYAGVTYAYHELVPDGLMRLTDPEWETTAPVAADVAWMEPVLR